MPVEFGTTVNDFTNNIMNNSFIHNAFSNPFYTSLILSIIIVLFIIILGAGELSTTAVIRKTIYIFLIVLTGLFINNTILIREREKNIKENVVDKTIKLGSDDDYGALNIRPKQATYNIYEPSKNSILDDLYETK